MSHLYPQLTKLVARWLDRSPKGTRMEEDFICERREEQSDEFIYFRNRRIGDGAPCAWRVVRGDREFYFSAGSRLSGDSKLPSMRSLIREHLKKIGTLFVELSSSRVSKVAGLDPAKFSHAECMAINVVDFVDGDHWRDEMLLELHGKVMLAGKDAIYGGDFYVEVPPSTRTVAEAYAFLDPKEAIEAKQARASYFRHGNWFLIRRSPDLDDSTRKQMKKRFCLPEAITRERRHVAALGKQDGEKIFISGLLTHPGMLRMQLDGLWEAVTCCPDNRC